MPSDAPAAMPPIVLLGNPRSRRLKAVIEAARRVTGRDVTVVSYPELLAGKAPPPASGSLVRIESPSECEATARALLKAGIGAMEAEGRRPISVSEIDDLAFDRGAIQHPLQWFLGFRTVLQELEESWEASNVRWMSSPSAIVQAFDKLTCLTLWSNAKVPIPERPVEASTYGGIREGLRDRHARLFLKLRYGYSAMGAVAIEWRDRLVRAITTVEVSYAMGRPRLYVTKRPRVLTREFEIAWLVDTLGMEEMLVERWLPKARHAGRGFDVRAVTIGGNVRHVVGRASSSPFTNLNLDAHRILPDELQTLLGEDWYDLIDVAERAAAALPDAGTLGIDLLVRPCRRRFAVLEANAFGDYLPGLLHAGRSTYETAFYDLFTKAEVAA